MSEVVFEKGEVQITKAIARFGRTSYPMANIGAVSVEDDPNWMMGIAGLLLVGSVGAWFIGELNVETMLALVGTSVVVATLGEYLSGLKLILRTSSGNEQAFRSRDKKLVLRIKEAIETAVATR